MIHHHHNKKEKNIHHLQKFCGVPSGMCVYVYIAWLYYFCLILW